MKPRVRRRRLEAVHDDDARAAMARYNRRSATSPKVDGDTTKKQSVGAKPVLGPSHDPAPFRKGADGQPGRRRRAGRGLGVEQRAVQEEGDLVRAAPYPSRRVVGGEAARALSNVSTQQSMTRRSLA